jgi:hypothetical protein
MESIADAASLVCFPSSAILISNRFSELADIDADHSDCAIGLLKHGCLRCPRPHSITGWAGAPDARFRAALGGIADNNIDPQCARCG